MVESFVKRGTGSPSSDAADLIVEDSAIIGAKLSRTVRKAGADVVGPVATVASAIDAIVARRWIDAALLDVDLGRHASCVRQKIASSQACRSVS